MNEIDKFVLRYNDFFHSNMENIRLRESKNFSKLNTFREKFSPSNMENISETDFIFESGKDDAFCYWVEYNLNDLGEVRVKKQNQLQKYGIQKINGEYVFLKKGQKKSRFGKTAEEVCKKIITEVNTLIKAIEESNFKAINDSILYEVFKAKLTYLYNPDKWIPICTKPDVETLLQLFNIGFSTRETLTDKRIKLYEFYLEIKKKIPYITTWEFMHCLYYHPFYRSVLRIENDKGNETKNSTDDINEDEENNQINIDDCDLWDFEGTYLDSFFQNGYRSSDLFKKSKSVKLNYQKKQQRNERIGKIGEKLICNDEISKLYNLKIDKEVNYIASKDDSKGFDIESYDENGKKIYIEVKTTRSNKQDFFYLTDTEKKAISEYGEQYKIYRVYNLNFKNKTYEVVIFDGLTFLEKFSFINKRFLCCFSKNAK